METVLRRLTSEACLVYLDDIIIVGRTFQEHLNNIRKVFQRLQKANLKLSPKKCRFFRKEVSYLGHIISADGVKTNPEKSKAVVEWPRPETVHDLRSFLGLCTYYRRFVRNFSAIARPLHKLTEAKSNFNWTEECEKSFHGLKQDLITSPVLTYPRTDKDGYGC
ncbi:Retrovirus-related Pol polyprotein from transposon 297 [Araneus ventricosus]|uniref:RNA-directed DNA polymerase n=1 Tax=Araneus ventricosus TaxID=182803 RepID=A0A4Y2EVZ8_ARAVE|nr:Retrovirus-related Pol polyprotein from transposon 297 [Araneus ventricosus]